ncbi:MAG: methylenetetrahydrofolate reductase [NAD(P)H] [Actinomycetota bacterium]|nr:methylenetetrahydrofolate reductase [NAD(P)H] [Actinomycetota bacterium]
MAKIAELVANGRTVSFEFFPPKTDEGERNLRETLKTLEPLRPSFVSVTYGAGGSTRDRTHRIVVDVLRQTSMTPMAHLTCVAHRRADLVDVLECYKDAGVENILALRGDPPRDQQNVAAGDLRYSIELVELVREVGDFSVGVAAHPEGHPHASDLGSDRWYLAAKLRAADFGITQFFFRAQDYLSMVDDLNRLGVEKPVIPGIMPVTNVKQVQRFAELSGADFPTDLADRLFAVADNPDEVRHIGVEVATQLCQRLLDEGAPGLHFYTLNRSTATREIHANLGLDALTGASDASA